MKKYFVCLKRINKMIVNILKGLELYFKHKGIVEFVYDLQNKKRNNKLGAFSCFYLLLSCIAVEKVQHISIYILNQEIECAVEDRLIAGKNDISPDILHNVIVNLISNLFKIMIKWLIGRFVLSFLSKCNIVFEYNLKVIGPGEFIGSTSIPLPVR
ncbi:hypothetical protein IEQ34_013651 [Dendrobium chrysotoxum]|uniref:Uncharacterized protein n=1 Tax=Dendrobium chrysotoxum TaxID=161865 RepID=A0AAV7GP27_DENCH|nr:hypothetical protein IEQ34_013651 [Dendrobium chrysotoxum]